MKLRDGIYLLISIFVGLAVALIDASPKWDDTIISATLIFVSGGIISFFYGTKPWLIALCTCCWLPLLNIYTLGNFMSLFAFIPGFAGSYFGYFVNAAIKQ